MRLVLEFINIEITNSMVKSVSMSHSFCQDSLKIKKEERSKEEEQKKHRND